MGWISRLFGKKPPPRPPRPEVLSGDDGSPYLVLRSGDNEVTLMDRDTFDYMYGESSAPDPLQADLDEVLRLTTSVRVLSGGVFRGELQSNEVLVECSGSELVSALQKSLRINTDPSTFNHCACFGGPTIELLDNGTTVALIGLQHGQAIRWRRWKHDAKLLEGFSLEAWFKKQGVDPELLEDIYRNRYQRSEIARAGAPALSASEQRLRRIDSQRISGDPNAALAACDKLLQDQPNLALAYGVRALCYRDLGQPERCADDCTSAIEGGLRLPLMWYTRAVCLDGLGLRKEAIADCTTIIAEIDPNYPNAYNSRGMMRALSGQMTEGISDLSKAIQLSPGWPLPLLNRGQFYQLAGNLDAAIADLTQLVAQVADSDECQGLSMKALGHWKLSECLSFKGEPARAKAALQAALLVDPELLKKLRVQSV